ncbi:MAG: formylglycine-generating enzyme family protein [Betaproteobacteria bacterium]|nr:formylglycine-generating enzyme family protein [Betaproteobacteria bacterium]NBY13541.1 formylglycine-generating enzyme family protein [Betaproteobacteria bacterium]NCA16209.1 formylglycine-generating enzyme family protein [Betaproteobacteria bacterium]
MLKLQAAIGVFLISGLLRLHAAPPVQGVDGVLPGERVRVGALLWDAHEFTVGQFREVVRASGLRTRAEQEGGGFIYSGGWQQKLGWTWQAPFGRLADDLEPAVHVTFDEAQAACRQVGARLPTDAEWTSAAYLEQRPHPPKGFTSGQLYRYPSGFSAGSSHCLQGCGTYTGAAPPGALDRGVGHVRIGTTPAGVNGLYDMGGNVWEWVDSGEGDRRVTRGASWWYGPERQLQSDRETKPRETRVAYIGFRCVREASASPSSPNAVIPQK